MAASGSSFMNPMMMGAGMGSMAGGLFGGLFGSDPGEPYKDASEQFEKYAGQAAGYQQPFYMAGMSAIPGYQSWLKSMSNPNQYINSLMKSYNTSPQEQYAQQQSMRAATNMGSASGLTGSTPLQLQAQENAGNISNQYMNDYLQNVLGINSLYGSGMSHLMGVGQGSANQLSNIYSNLGNQMAEMMYGKEAARQKQDSDMWSSLGGLGGAAAGLAFL